MDALQQYQELLKQPVDAGVVKQLHQPERHVLLVFKVFAALLARIVALEARVGALGAAQAAKEFPKSGEVFWAPVETPTKAITLPAIAPRDREAQG